MHEFRDLDDGGRQAAINAVVEVFRHADLSDAAIIDSDADATVLTRRIRAQAPPFRDWARAPAGFMRCYWQSAAIVMCGSFVACQYSMRGQSLSCSAVSVISGLSSPVSLNGCPHVLCTLRVVMIRMKNSGTSISA